MRVACLAAGAGRMYCGSCMHANRLAATLIAEGRDVVLIPLYTPLRTDEPDASQRRVFYGGINVYLQQVVALFRHTPWFFDWLLDAPALLRGLGRLTSSTRPEALGALTLSVLKAEHGAQRKELEKLVVGLRQLRPDLLHLPNLMFVGLARQLKANVGAPVLCGLVGEDVFLDRLPEPYRSDVFEAIRQRAEDVDGFVALTEYYAKHAAQYFGLPSDRVHRIAMGIRAADFSEAAAPADEPFTIGYLARICPEKGLAELCEAFVRLRRAGKDCRLRVAGYLGKADRPYFDRVLPAIRQAGLDDNAFEYVGEVTRQEKHRFLRSLHVLAVPTTYPESKGLYVLEALAAGVPVVLPSHGSCPELIDATGGGLLHEAANSRALAEVLARLMGDSALRRRLAADGRDAVHKSFTADRMAAQAWQLFQQFASPRPSADSTLPERGPC
ncbi:MAG: glycosyltransferase family 4 protein [Phycisphaerae bacterium]